MFVLLGPDFDGTRDAYQRLARATGLVSYDLKDVFDEGSITDKRELLHAVIGAVMVRSVGKKAPVHQRVRGR